MKKTCDIVLIVIILNLAIAGIANAQQDSRVHSDFRKIEIYMIKVWELVRQFNDPKAIEYMVLAKVEIDKARELLFRDDPRYLMARIHMTKAKQFTDLAARRVLSKPFLNLKAQLDDLIIRAENVSAGSNSDEVHYLLNQAKKYRRQAYAAFTENRIARGEEYFRISFFFAKKCIDYVKTSSTDLSEQFKNLVISVRQLLTQVEELLADNKKDHLKNLLREAESHFEETLVLAEKGITELFSAQNAAIKD